jgi:hypothetical protein
MSNTTRTSLITCAIAGHRATHRLRQERAMGRRGVAQYGRNDRGLPRKCATPSKGNQATRWTWVTLPDFVESTSFKYGGRDLYVQRRRCNHGAGDFTAEVAGVARTNRKRLGDSQPLFALCAKPNYVQLVPDETGQKWTWPDKIELWTYNLPANLLARSGSPPSEAKRRYTMADKAAQPFMRDPRLIHSQKINPLATSQDCHETNKP